jgi:hypothetical protein
MRYSEHPATQVYPISMPHDGLCLGFPHIAVHGLMLENRIDIIPFCASIHVHKETTENEMANDKTRTVFSAPIVQAQNAITQAHLHLFNAMMKMDAEDINVAFGNGGYTNNSMRPLDAKFLEVKDGVWIYECTWWDDNADDGSLIRNNVYVKYQNGQITADV